MFGAQRAPSDFRGTARRPRIRRPLERRQVEPDQRARPPARGAHERRARQDPARQRLSAGDGGGGAPCYLLDLPGYGYARAPKGARGAPAPRRRAADAGARGDRARGLPRRSAGASAGRRAAPGARDRLWRRGGWIPRRRPERRRSWRPNRQAWRGERIRALKELRIRVRNHRSAVFGGRRAKDWTNCGH